MRTFKVFLFFHLTLLPHKWSHLHILVFSMLRSTAYPRSRNLCILNVVDSPRGCSISLFLQKINNYFKLFKSFTQLNAPLLWFIKLLFMSPSCPRFLNLLRKLDQPSFSKISPRRIFTKSKFNNTDKYFANTNII